MKLEVETNVLKGELVQLSQVARYWTNHISNCRARVRSIPHKMTHRVMAASEHSVGLRLLENEVEEALLELAGMPLQKKVDDIKE